MNGEEYRHLDTKVDRLTEKVDLILGGIAVAKWMSGAAITIAVGTLAIVLGK